MGPHSPEELHNLQGRVSHQPTRSLVTLSIAANTMMHLYRIALFEMDSLGKAMGGEILTQLQAACGRGIRIIRNRKHYL